MQWIPLVSAAADLFLGGACGGCGRPGVVICTVCRAGIQEAPVTPVVREVPGFPATFARGSYSGPLRGLILCCKERGGLSLVPLLAQALVGPLAEACLTGGAAGTVVVPVPSGADRVRQRGFDLTGMLARRAAKPIVAAGLPLRVRALLRQRRGVLDQAGLGAQERRTNLTGGLEVRRSDGPAMIVLVDDIVTTGATLGAAATALTAAGHRVCGAAVLADTRKLR